MSTSDNIKMKNDEKWNEKLFGSLVGADKLCRGTLRGQKATSSSNLVKKYIKYAEKGILKSSFNLSCKTETRDLKTFPNA